jgi:glycosyltransferase involved in cell wall biosynthesis
MKVIYSNGARFAGGGIGTTAYHAVRGLHRHGMLYRLLCGSYRPMEIPEESIRSMGLPSRALRRLAVYDRGGGLDYFYNTLYDLWSRTQLEPCGLFHGWGSFCQRTLRQAKALGAVTVVERASSYPLYQARILREEYARWGLEFHIGEIGLRRAVEEIEAADSVVIPSDFVRQSFLEFGFPEERLIQVPYGADIARFRPVESQTASDQSGPFRLLFVGQVSVRKGVPYLLEAWKRLDWQDAELWLVGNVDSGLSSILPRYTGLPGLHLMGYVPDPVTVYGQSDLFVFPSIEEGSALVTYEALACGLPVVTTHNAGSVVRDGVEGFITPVRDVDALVQQLEVLRSDRQLRCEMGAAARARAEAFSWERYGDALAEAHRHRVSS